MITKDSIETAYSFLHQKRNVYIHSTLDWQKDDIEYAIGSYVDDMSKELYEDGDYILSTWHPEKNYQGWVNTMHGGILSTLIDEVCGWVVTRKLQTSGYTVQLNVKFRKAVPTTEPELTIKAKVTKQVRNLVYINAEITNSNGELCNEGEAVYFLMNQEKAKEMGFTHCEVEDE